MLGRRGGARRHLSSTLPQPPKKAHGPRINRGFVLQLRYQFFTPQQPAPTSALAKREIHTAIPSPAYTEIPGLRPPPPTSHPSSAGKRSEGGQRKRPERSSRSSPFLSRHGRRPRSSRVPSAAGWSRQNTRPHLRAGRQSPASGLWLLSQAEPTAHQLSSSWHPPHPTTPSPRPVPPPLSSGTRGREAPNSQPKLGCRR